MKLRRYFLALVFLLPVFAGMAQFNPNTICRVENGKIYFKIDLNWTMDQKKELARLFDLDSVVLAGVFAGKTEVTVKDANWVIVKLNDHLVELSKKIQAMPVRSASPFSREGVPTAMKMISEADTASLMREVNLRRRFFLLDAIKVSSPGS